MPATINVRVLRSAVRVDTGALVRFLLILALLALALYHVLLTGSTVLAFGLRYPFMDQLRENLRYLTTPFPDNVLRLANGHRPVLPGLVRVIELKWLHGIPVVQLVTAWLAAGATALWLLACVGREFRHQRLLLTVACCAICILLFWNAYARMFIQPFEAVHVFYVVAFLVLALRYATGVQASGVRPWIMALAACGAATFSFGTGIASFAAVLAVAVLRRASSAIVIAIVTAAAATFALYYFVLPGADGVRGNIADVSLSAGTFFIAARVGAIAGELMRPYDIELGTQALVASALGGSLLVVLASAVIRQWLRREPFDRIALVGAGLATFGATVNALIAQSRMAYFFDYPDQLFADRYLFWSGITWLGGALFALPRLRSGGRGLLQGVAAALVLLCALAVPPALWWNTWSAEVYRKSELATVAARLGLRDNPYIAAVSELPPDGTYRAIEEMRKHDVATFANNGPWQIGTRVPLGETERAPVVKLSRVNDGTSPQLARLVAGRLSRSVAAREQRSELWFADNDGVLIGLATLSMMVDKPRALRLGVPIAAGFRGYVVMARPPAFLLARHGNGAPHLLARLLPDD